MGRIRSIKPEFPHSESMGRVSRDARLTFIQLWTLCDDHGRTRGSSRMLASLLYPYDPDAPDLIDRWLGELQREGCINRYEEDDGAHYLEVVNWGKHQKIDHPSKPRFPAPREGSRILSTPRELSPLDRGSGIEDRGPGSKEASPWLATARAKSLDRPEDVSEQVWQDYLTHRKAKKAPVTATVIAQTRREAVKAGISLEEAMTATVATGWIGFRADWHAKVRSTSSDRIGAVPKSIPLSAYSTTKAPTDWSIG